MDTAEKTVIISAAVPPALRERLAREASEADRSLSAQVRRVLAAHIAQAGPATARTAGPPGRTTETERTSDGEDH